MFPCIDALNATKSAKFPEGSKAAAARKLGISRPTFRDKLAREQQRSAKRASFAALPDVEDDPHEIIEQRCRAYTRQKARRDAERWYPITVPETGPFGLMVFGDEHADDNNCDWPALKRDLALARETPGVYACAMGDASNNWVGRLMREYADQSVTRSQTRTLMRWLLSPDAAPWLFRLIGNHDLWHEGDVLIGLFGGDTHYVAAWEGRIELRAGGERFRIHAAHDFKGDSIYNKTHGPSRAAMFSGGAAELYLCGHKHTFGHQSFEIEETRRYVHSVRAPGYKKHDLYAVTKGFGQGEAPGSVFVLFNPLAETPAGRITIFNDPVLGCRMLEALRAQSNPKRSKSNAGIGTDGHRAVRAGRRGKVNRRKNSR
jgi:hypothetical protein